MMRIYVASSWRNQHQQHIVRFLREAGHEVYDFRLEENGTPGGFQWTQLPNWTPWPPTAFREQLKHPAARHGYDRDMTALRDCDVCVLVLPCGRSAHLELGYALGSNGKGVIVHYPHGIAPQEPELMYLECAITVTGDELLDAVEQHVRCEFRANDNLKRCGLRLREHAEMNKLHPHTGASA